MNEFPEPLPAIGDDYHLRCLTADDGAAVFRHTLARSGVALR